MVTGCFPAHTVWKQEALGGFVASLRGRWVQKNKSASFLVLQTDPCSQAPCRTLPTFALPALFPSCPGSTPKPLPASCRSPFSKSHPHLNPHLRVCFWKVQLELSSFPWFHRTNFSWSMKMELRLICAQLCLSLRSPMDCSPPGSSVHGILQARILEWVDIPYSRGPSQPKQQTCISCVSCLDRRILYYHRRLGCPG